jgi:5,10-methenyltetrahydrofolate synthetase
VQGHDGPPGDLDDERAAEPTSLRGPGPGGLVGGTDRVGGVPRNGLPGLTGIPGMTGMSPEAGGQPRPGPGDALEAGVEVVEAKARLRSRLLALRRVAGPAPYAARLANRVLCLPEVSGAGCVAAYVGMSGEPDTVDLLDRLRARGVRVLLPILRGDLDLDFRQHTGTLVPGAMGTREPPTAAPSASLTEAEVVIIPALAVDRAGRRLGRGGGSYDRALARVDDKVPVIAVLHDREVLEWVPAERHDRSVKIIVTPSRTLRCEPADDTGEHPGPSRS